MKIFKQFIGSLQKEYFPVEDLLETIRKNDMDKFDWIMSNRITHQNVNYFNSQRVTPLRLACEQRHITFIEKLLAAGANPNFRNFDSETILMLVAKQTNKSNNQLNNQWLREIDDYDYFDSFSGTMSQFTPKKCNNSNNNNPFEKDILRILQMLLKARGDVNAMDSQKNTALIHCIKNNHHKAVPYLLEQGANPFVINTKNESSVSLCIKEEQTDILRIIIDKCQKTHEVSLIQKNIKQSAKMNELFAHELEAAHRKIILDAKLPAKAAAPRRKI